MSMIPTKEQQIAELERKNQELRSHPNLGLATTRELLEEIRIRIQVDYHNGGGGLEYTTVNGRPQ